MTHSPETVAAPERAGLTADDVRKLLKGTTPGPWGWFGCPDALTLATKHSGRRYVMDFVRKGMRGAQPRFQPGKDGMVSADCLLQFAVGDKSVRGDAEAKANDSVYRYDVVGVDAPDARLIAAVPELAEALLAALAAPAPQPTAQGWRVKPLEWRMFPMIRATKPEVWGAEAGLVAYRCHWVFIDGRDKWTATLRTMTMDAVMSEGPLGRGVYDSRDEAQAVCDADYEARIASALATDDWKARAEKAEAALAFYATIENWRVDGPLDGNSGNFTGGPARDVLATLGGAA